MIVDETLDLLRMLYGQEIETVTIDKIMIGVFFSGVKLSDGSGGISYTPVTDLHSATGSHSMAGGAPCSCTAQRNGCS